MSDPTARLRAVLALPREPSSAPALLAAVEDVSLDVARAALRRLVPLAGPTEIAALRERMLALDIGLVADVAAALRKLGDEDAPRVAANGLEATAASRRQKAAIALRELRAQTSRPVLVRALGDDATPVRRLALEALGRLPADAAAVVAVRRALSDPDASVRAAAVRADVELDSGADKTLAAVAADGARVVREALAGAGCSLAGSTVEVLLADETAEVRVAALRALEGCPERVPLPRLLSCLGDESWQVRRAACDAVASAGGEEAGRALIRMLLDRRLEVRGRAVVALERLYGGALDETFAEALSVADGRLRLSLIELLGLRGRADVVLRYVADPVPEVRIVVARALGGVRSPETERGLRALAEDADAGVRNAAAVVLESQPR